MLKSGTELALISEKERTRLFKEDDSTEDDFFVLNVASCSRSISLWGNSFGLDLVDLVKGTPHMTLQCLFPVNFPSLSLARWEADS
jgi:hypothetical protein